VFVFVFGLIAAGEPPVEYEHGREVGQGMCRAGPSA
jgi:hypothetical protein